MTDPKDSKLPVLYRSLQGHNDSIESICFNSNSQQVASVSGDSLLYLWNMQANKIQAKKLKGHSAAITEVLSYKTGRLQSLRATNSNFFYGPYDQNLEQQWCGKLSFNSYQIAWSMCEDCVLQS